MSFGCLGMKWFRIFLALLVLFPLLFAMELVPVPMSIRQDEYASKETPVSRQRDKEETDQKKCYSIAEASDFCAAFIEANEISPDRIPEPSTDHAEINFDELVDTLHKQRDNTLEDKSNKTLFQAHKLVLGSASPVLESVLSATNAVRMPHIRIPGLRPEVFKTFIDFIYTGRVCLDNFDKACDLLHAARRLQVIELVQYCRSFLWGKLYPHNVWRGYQCGFVVKDDELREAALQIAQWKTDEVLKDASFHDISLSTLTALLSKDELSVSSELELYEASLRWAMVAAARKGKPKDPATLKQILGPALGLIRFLTLTPKEFTESQISSKILNYTETLAILFNYNSPGSMPLPDNLSMNSKPRLITNSTKYFEVIASNIEKHSCRKQYKNFILNKNSFDVYSTFDFSINKNFTLNSIEIPSQVKSRHRQLDFDFDNDMIYDLDTSDYYEEHVTVNIIWKNNILLYSVPFKSDVQYNALISLPFSDSYQLKYHKNDPMSNMYKIKIIFHKSGKYPSKFAKPKPANSVSRIENRKRKIIWYPSGNNFVYSMSYF